jgi:hypothetical protein
MTAETWIVTTEDVATVLDRHGVRPDENTVEALRNGLDVGKVTEVVTAVETFDGQLAANLREIERQLIEQGVVDNPPRF